MLELPYERRKLQKTKIGKRDLKPETMMMSYGYDPRLVWVK
tara:strand:- start:351 stop:473 length:123 start_codon:yes stop_codon:yes gene_type:complete